MKHEPQSSYKTIGFLRRGYSPTGGAEAYLKRLAGGLHQRGHRVVLLGTGEWPREEWPGGEVIVLPQKSLRDFGVAALRVRKEKTIDLLFSFERVPGCDIFRAGDGVHAAWLKRQRCITFGGYGFMKKWMPKHREILRLEQELFSPKSQTKIIANSAMVAREIMEEFSVTSERITIIPNGVPISPMITVAERAILREKFGMQEQECIVLFIGSGWKRKGLETALKAVERVMKQAPQMQMKLWVAGKGKEARFQNGIIKFLGSVKDVTQLCAAADLFILPTLYDPFSNASLEALAAGLPVITSAANGCSEILNPDFHGSIIADPRDEKAFASALLHWRERLQSKEEALKIRAACWERGAAFSMEKNVAETIKLMEQVLEGVLKKLKSRITASL